MIDRTTTRFSRIARTAALFTWLVGHGATANAAVPSAPTMKTPVSNSELNITVPWTASATGTVTGYQVERCKNSGCTNFAQIAAVGSTVTSYADNTLNPSSVYRYRVRATSSSGSSAYSAIGTATTQAFAAPTSLSASSASATAINLSFVRSSSGGTSSTLIERCTGSSCSNFAQVGTSTTTSFSNTGLTPQTTYRYRIRATDPVGNFSPYSSIVSASTPATDTQAPTTPTGLAGSAASSTQINVSWTASTDNVGVANYQLQRCTGSGCTSFAALATVTTTSFTDTGRTPSTTYRYRVLAADAAGNLSAFSSIATATTPAAADTQAPTAPTALSSSPVSATQINLSWTASTDNVGVTGYRVERCVGVGCSNFAQIATPTTASYSNTGLVTATSYSYRVRAADAAGNLSTYSQTSSALTPDNQAPTAPSSLGGTVGPGSVIGLAWQAASDNVGVTLYLIERCAGVSCSTFSQVATATATNYSDTSVTAGSTYTYRVRASDAAANLGPYSNTAAAAIPAGSGTYTYDSHGRLQTITTSSGSVITYTYDAAGNLIRIQTTP
jgi:YD repeat-containing protein